ncbi:MAG TPA: M56 family metallopeptidase [Kofleriaceae bacterium]|nr:M56 family metallopeptidase [Kofleriaceae bacterium]
MTAALQGAGDWLLTGLVHGTALALLTALALATVLRRTRPALVAALWTIVLVKFLVPVGPRADFSLSSALERVLPAAAAAGEAPATLQPAAAGLPAAAPDGPPVPWLALGLAGLYLAGVALAAWRLVAARRALRRRLRGLPAADPEVTSAIDRAAEILRLGAAPPARIDRGASGPYLVGALRPVLVLPAWLPVSSPAWWAGVLHELAHVKRRDPLLALGTAAACCLFWFWPPVAWSRRALERAREMACDEWALARGPLGALDYARFLVDVATRRGQVQPAMALIRSKSQLAARVDHLVDGDRAPALGRGRAAAVAGWAALCLAGAGGVAAAEVDASLECSIEPDLIAQILASHPDADADRDGVLSRDEACAHQRRMRQRLLDQVVDAEMVSQLDPAADLDGDGLISDYEVDWAKNQIDVGLAADSGDALVLEYAGERALPVKSGEVRVAAAAHSGRVCRANTACGEVATGGRFPLLIDVSTSQE